MKSLWNVLGISVCLLGMTAIAPAQTFGIVKVHLPVEAHFGRATVAPGDYDIHAQQASGDASVITLESEHGPSVEVNSLYMMEWAPQAYEKSELILSRHGDEYRVTEIHIGGTACNLRLLPAEK